MKKILNSVVGSLLGWLLVTSVISFPWKLSALALESFVIEPSVVQQHADNDKYWDVKTLTVRLRIRYGFEVEYVPNLLLTEHAYGVTYAWPKRLIQIDDSLSWSERYRVLTHEAAHVLQPMRMTDQENEVFAESVSALITHDGLVEHARYLSEFKSVLPVTFLFRWRDIYKAAEQLERD